MTVSACQTDSGTTATFVYDAFGRRTSKTIGGVTTQFLYGRANPVQELSAGTPIANLLTGRVDEVFTRTDAVGARHFLADALGNTVALTDSSGTLLTQYTYEPFGNTSVSGSTSANSYQYTGRENDGAGLYYYRARYHSATSQRFISEDPLDFGGGDSNIYTYVSNSPTNFTDLLGLSDLVFNRANGTLTLYDNVGNKVGEFPAANNASSDSKGPWPDGTYNYSHHVAHAADPNGPFGSNGNFVFDVPGRPGMGVHSGRRGVPDALGRRGPQHATKGCIRTTDAGTQAIDALNEQDPLRTMTVE